MKKIVPFNNVLTFETTVNEITAISLEHSLEKDMDSLSGVFYISGEYKMLNGGINPEKFNFELPFDIALGSRYKMNSMVVDIDDFRYELIDTNKMKVNIDLYIDGEELTEEVLELQTKVPLVSELNLTDDEVEERKEEYLNSEKHHDNCLDVDECNEDCTAGKERSDKEEIKEETCKDTTCQEDMEQDIEEGYEKGEDVMENQVDDNLVKDTFENDIKREDEIIKDFMYNDDGLLDKSKDIVNENTNENNNIMNNLSDSENYVTYKVYRIVEGDTLDNILTKYKVTKEELLSYNDNITNLKTGDKLIIPFK